MERGDVDSYIGAATIIQGNAEVSVYCSYVVRGTPETLVEWSGTFRDPTMAPPYWRLDHTGPLAQLVLPDGRQGSIWILNLETGTFRGTGPPPA